MMDETFHIRVDTTYSTAEVIKTTEIDTLYRIGVKNEDNLSLIDTIWVNSKILMIIKIILTMLVIYYSL